MHKFNVSGSLQGGPDGFVHYRVLNSNNIWEVYRSGVPDQQSAAVMLRVSDQTVGFSDPKKLSALATMWCGEAALSVLKKFQSGLEVSGEVSMGGAFGYFNNKKETSGDSPATDYSRNAGVLCFSPNARMLYSFGNEKRHKVEFKVDLKTYTRVTSTPEDERRMLQTLLASLRYNYGSEKNAVYAGVQVEADFLDIKRTDTFRNTSVIGVVGGRFDFTLSKPTEKEKKKK